MNTRTLTESDYEILSGWWKAWSWPVIGKDMLPDNGTGGIMVEHEGKNIVAGFLYWSNSKMVWLDWIISNPKSDKYMMSISRSNSLLKIHKELGWTIDPDPSHEMIKAII